MTTKEKLLDLYRSIGDVVRPPETPTVSEWADRYRYLSPEASVAMKWHTWPYQREIMDAMGSDDPCDQVVVKAASQLVKTEAILNAIGRAICCDPGPIAVFEAGGSDAEAFSKDRMAPMIRDTAPLRERMVEAKSRDSGNTIGQKAFMGGTLYILGAGSASNLAMRPIRYLFRDEGDRWLKNIENEGSPHALSERRTSRFWNRKIVDTSSPTDEDGFIHQRFLLSDQAYWSVACPGCKAMQRFEWGGVTWGEPEEGKEWQLIGGGILARIPIEHAHYMCVFCRKLIPHSCKPDMNEGGLYIKENPDSKIRGFHCNALCYPIRSWGHYAMDAEAKKNNPSEWKSFVNTVLAEVYKEPGTRPDWEVLRGRTAPYVLCDVAEATLPEGVLFLTAAVDVQRGHGGEGWVEAHVWGWGRDRRSWLIDILRIDGKITGETVQAKLHKYLFESKFKHSCGLDLSIERSAIDSGEESEVVYAWSRKAPYGKLLVIKGVHNGVSILGQPNRADVNRAGKKIRRGITLWPVNVWKAKEELYEWLLKPRNDDGTSPACFISLPSNISDAWLKQLTSEEWRTKKNKKTGYEEGYWHQTQDRNEALDIRNYNRAAAIHLGMDRYTENDWLARERMLASTGTVVAAPRAIASPVEVIVQPTPQSQESPRRTSDPWVEPTGGYWDR